MNFMDRSYQFYEGLPSWGKAIVVIGGGGIAWFGIINPARKLIIKKLDETKAQQTVNKFSSDVSSLSKQGIRPSYSDAQYKAWADKISSQFDGCDFSVAILGGYSTSGQTVVDVLKLLKNDADFAKLVTAYGVRTYDQCGPFTGNFTGDLFHAVSDELRDYEIQGLNNQLQLQKINYRF